MQKLVSAIHATPFKVVLAVTGGGSASISELLKVAGASNTLLEAIVPYSESSLKDYIESALIRKNGSFSIQQSCSMDTARKMAMAAWKRALMLDPMADHDDLMGIGCTAALSTNRDRKGNVRAFVAVQTNRETRIASLDFEHPEYEKGTRGNRFLEEQLTSEFILHNLAEATGVTNNFIPAPKQKLTIARAPEIWPDLYSRELVSTFDNKEQLPVFSGSFNPLHEGHEKMIDIARKRLGMEVILEICINNVDKLPLDFIEINHRLDQIAGKYPVTFTNAPRFLEKASLFPGSTFIVGTDTIKRLADIRYYRQPEELDMALSFFESNNNRFLVFCRDSGEGLERLEDLKLPDILLGRCEAVPPEEFHLNISSSKLRNQLDAKGNMI